MKNKKVITEDMGVDEELIKYGKQVLADALKREEHHVMTQEPSDEDASKYVEQSRYVFSRAYEMFCNFIDNTIIDVTKTTEAEFDKAVYKFAMVLVPALEKEFPEVFNAFIAPLMPEDKKEAIVVRNSILSYCGNLLVQPLVLAIATRFLEHRDIEFKTSGKANKVVMN